MTITELSIKRPTLVVVIFSILGVLGLFSYSQLKYDLLPKISPPVLMITTVYPGASPNEVETSVTKLIEDAVSGIDKIARVNATSLEGRSFVSVEFVQSAKIDLALQDAQRKVNEVTARLPEDAQTPIISKFALDEIPVLRIGVSSSLPSREFYQFLKDQIRPRLSQVSGVAQVSLLGGDEREIKVNLDMQKLRGYGLSIAQTAQMIKASNLDFPTGKIKDKDGQYIIRVAGKFESIEQMRNLVIGRSRQGGEIKLSDVAEVQDGQAEYTQLNRLDGTPSVGIWIVKQSEANSVDVSKLARIELEKLAKEHANKQLKFEVAQDGSTFTMDAANAVLHDLELAILLVAAVMLLFLHSVRNSLIVMIAIPASLVSTFIGMYILGFSLNLMTLLAMSLVVGILVDDSIVVLENIYRHLEMGEDNRNAALRGRNEIGFAALSITLVDVVVFLPLSLVSGIVGNILREFALVVVISTLMSLFVSFTVTPLLASRFSKLEHLTKNTLMGRFSLFLESMIAKLTKEYLLILKWSLKHRFITLSLTAVAFFAAFALVGFGFIGGEFMTQTDRGEFSVAIELPPGAKFENTNLVSLDAERIIRSIPEVQKVITNVGVSSEGLLGQAANNAAEFNVTLSPKNRRVRSTDEIGHEIKVLMQEIPGVKVRVNPIGIFGTANQTPVQIVVSAANRDEVMKAANLIVDSLRTIKGTADVRLSSEEGKPEVRVDIDRNKMAAFGLTIGDVGQTLRVALSGDDNAKFRDGNNEHTIRIQLDEFDRAQTKDLSSLTFINARGQQVELKQFANVYQATGPTKLQRENRTSSVTIFSQVVNRPVGSIGKDFERAWKNLKDSKMIPEGVNFVYQGDLKNQADGFSSLGLALLAAILFMYLIMVALYDSYLYPFVVLFSVPLAIIGAFLALALSMKTLNIFSILGLIMLTGLVAKNAILLVDRTNQMREEGYSTLDALIEAGETRLRPILMTTLAMIIGMMPIALSSSSGSEWKQGLAWALIGGLTSSMFLTLVVVPIVYFKFDRWRTTIPAFFARVGKVFGFRKSPNMKNDGATSIA